LVAVSYLHVSLVICRTPRQDDEKGLKYFELPRSLTCVWLHNHRERIDSYAQEHIIARRADTNREQDENLNGQNTLFNQIALYQSVSAWCRSFTCITMIGKYSRMTDQVVMASEAS
jgi:hypothetical protein